MTMTMTMAMAINDRGLWEEIHRPLEARVNLKELVWVSRL
jgi:hypothetical protein